ncbi:MAG: NGG1p interacting factor NIF3 [Patescibacteria group bacterium]
MKLQAIYDLVVGLGRQNDPRPMIEVKRFLSEEKKAYEKLDKQKKELFDAERLQNPYADTRILFGDSAREIKKMAVGIDLDSSELLLINELNKSGGKIDLAFAHHPEGIALARLADVMKLQEEMYEEVGVPANVIEKLMDKEVTRVDRAIHPINHEKNIDLARLLKIPYLCAHTAADNMAYRYIQKLMGKKKPRTVGDAIDILLGEPEYETAAKRGVAPLAFVGSKKSKAGKVTVTGFTGGTSGSPDVYESLKQAGIGTEIAMHMKPEAQKEAEKHHINVVVAGHIASDSLGMNLLCDEIEKKGVKILPLGGFTRFKRT